MWGSRRHTSAIRIQSAFRGFLHNSDYQVALCSLKKVQANILRRTGRAAYIAFRQDVIKCQSVVRGFLVRKWYASAKGTLAVLANHLPHQAFPAAYRHMASYEEFELATPD